MRPFSLGSVFVNKGLSGNVALEYNVISPAEQSKSQVSPLPDTVALYRHTFI
jgi:hypothetical protein